MYLLWLTFALYMMQFPNNYFIVSLLLVSRHRITMFVDLHYKNVTSNIVLKI